MFAKTVGKIPAPRKRTGYTETNEQILSQIVMGNSIPAFVINNDGIITHWNRACERLTGKSSAEMVGTQKQWSAFYSEKRPVLADLIVGGASMDDISTYYNGNSKKSDLIPGAYEAEDFFPDLGKNGKWLFFTAAPLKDSREKVIGALETLQDFTKRRQDQENLFESERRYKLLTENVADGVGIIQNKKIVFVNRAFLNILGFCSEEDLLGKDIIHFISSRYRKHYQDMEKSFQHKGLEENEIQIECVRSDGCTCWIEAHNNFIKWDGQPALLTTIRDITGRKQKEQAIREEAYQLKIENIRLKSRMKNRFGMGQMVGKSKPMQEVYDQIVKAASTMANVVVYGESGTGKELVARSIHDMSDRSDKEFIAVNCGAIPEHLIESEFFGYKKGAFTGANIDKSGYLQSADGGTLFFDEVGEIPLNMQVKLLRAIEGNGFTPIGSTVVKKTDVRIIAATNKNLKDHVKNGLMREDFFYRIHIIPIHMPPLRRRKDDLPLLVYHFMQELNGDGKGAFIPERFFKAMQDYDWPGNVRELENAIHRFMTLKTMDFLNVSQHEPEAPLGIENHNLSENAEKQDLRSTLKDFEKNIILNALEQNKWNRTQTAKALGLERRSLQRKLQRFELN